MTKPIEEMTLEELLESVPAYTREEFEADRARLRAAIATKHGIAESEVEALIAEHRYHHEEDAPEDEYLGIMSFAHAAGWT